MIDWRKVFGFFGGLLLLLPLLCLVVISRFNDLAPPSGPRLVPRLNREEHSRLQTFLQPCQSDAECELPLACFFIPQDGRWSCGDSICSIDADCSPGFTCQQQSSVSGTAVHQICVPVGVRAEGEECHSIPDSAEDACKPGLRCHGYCGRPCEPARLASCPAGFFCKDAPAGALCWPTCTGQTCPEGQECIDKGEAASICARVEGFNCLRTPCPEGQRCIVQTRPSDPHVAWTRCNISCDPQKQDCPGGMTCFIRSCFRPCDPQGPNTCGPPYTCRQLFKGAPWFCGFKHRK